ncbi:MAG TPA: hypothetical protein VGD37_21770 [Kofleriaceae bacterium]|jgi:hypothetical protein
MIDGHGSRSARNPPAGLGPLAPHNISPFGAILRRAVHATPGAIGGAFADSDGEMIDGFTTHDPHDWALLTAHYGIVLSQLHAALGTLHFGGPEHFIAEHGLLDIVLHAVPGGYYVLVAITKPAPLGHALRSLRLAARELHREML